MTAAPKTILLVEDEALTALTEIRQIQREGYTVVHALTGEEAVEIVRNAPDAIDLILMDINLGRGLDGTQAAQAILKDHDLPILFLSAHTEPDIVAKTEKITSYGYVVKNTGSTVLAASIKMAFKLHAAHQTIQRTNERLGLALDASRAGAWDWDILPNAFNWSPEFLEIFGMSPDTTATLATWTQAVHPEDRESAVRRIQEAVENHIDLVQDYRIVLPGGEIRWIRATGRTYYAGDQPLRMIGLCMDITGRKQAEEALKKNEARLLEAERVAGLGAWEWDAKADRVTWSKELYALALLDENLPAPTYAEHPRFYTEESMCRLDEAVQQAIQTGEPYELDLEMVRTDGSRKWLSARGEAIYGSAHQFTGLRGTVMDITERKRSEQQSKEAKEYFEIIFNLNPDAVQITRLTDGHVVNINDGVTTMSGFTRQDLIGKTTLEVDIWENPQDRQNVVAELLQKGYCENYETVLKRKDGGRLVGMLSARLFSLQGVPHMITVTRDITENKRAREALQESEKHYRDLFENASIAIFQSAVDGKIQAVNPEFVRMFGYRSEEELKETVKDAADLFADPRRRAEIIRLRQENPALETFENVYLRKDGSSFTGQLTIKSLTDMNGQVLSLEGFVEDITKRKSAEEALRQALAEKEVLMRELQHRVKNSLAMAASLIHLEQGQLTDEHTRVIFADTQTRLQTMAILYEYLSQGDRVDRVDLCRYLQDLIETWSLSYLAPGGPVKIETCCAALELEPKRAMSLGLIVNELVTNALKYAFPAGRQGVIRVELEETADSATLYVSDNGVGMPPGSPKKSGLGLKLVNMITRQLEGKLTMEGEQGVRVVVTFRKSSR